MYYSRTLNRVFKSPLVCIWVYLDSPWIPKNGRPYCKYILQKTQWFFISPKLMIFQSNFQSLFQSFHSFLKSKSCVVAFIKTSFFWDKKVLLRTAWVMDYPNKWFKIKPTEGAVFPLNESCNIHNGVCWMKILK